MTYEELCKLIDPSEKEEKVFMPNEIFEDLRVCIKKAPHIAFAYSYLYLTSWLYRYTKYAYVSSDTILNNDRIKEILGYNPKQQSLNYLIKQNGLLDEIEYTETLQKDYPISWEYNNDSDLTFMMYSDLDKEFQDALSNLPRNHFIKKPKFAFERVLEDEKGEEYELSGTYYDVVNTHMIDFNVFLFCMSNNKIGCMGFYLYSFFKHKNDIFGSYDIPLTRLSEETGIPSTTLDRYMNVLKSYRMIKFRHNQDFFVVGLREEERKANTYIVEEYYDFNDTPMSFKKIDIMKREDYLLKLKEENEELLISKKLDIDMNELPF